MIDNTLNQKELKQLKNILQDEINRASEYSPTTPSTFKRSDFPIRYLYILKNFDGNDFYAFECGQHTYTNQRASHPLTPLITELGNTLIELKNKPITETPTPPPEETPNPPLERRLLRLKDIKQITGLSHTTIYNLMKNNNFPQSHKLTPSLAVWDAIAVQKWIDERFAQTNKT